MTKSTYYGIVNLTVFILALVIAEIFYRIEQRNEVEYENPKRTLTSQQFEKKIKKGR